MIRVWLICLAATAAALPAAAAPYGVLGAEIVSCTTWASDRHGHTPAATADEDWVMGYITAYNFTTQGDIAKGTNNAALAAWIDNYCSAHPSDSLATASAALITDLFNPHAQNSN